jgi:uncharacterized Fe-S center protein
MAELSEGVDVKGRSFKHLRLARTAVEAGGLVNLAKFKTHGQMGLTLAVKNLFGCVPGFAKPTWHLKAGDDRDAFARLLVDVAASLPARLHVLDAVVAMEGNGPGAGTPRPLNALLASVDPVALDRVACEFVGFPPAALGLFRAARDLGFGETERNRIEVLGDDVRSLAVTNFRPASTVGILATIPLPHSVSSHLRTALTPSPALFANRCRACGRCATVCAAKAIRFDDRGRPLIRRDSCVRCLCCQEICPEGAIKAKRNWFGR